MELVPNRSLKHAIERFASSNGITLAVSPTASVPRAHAPPSPSTASSSKVVGGKSTGTVMDIDNRTIRAQGIVSVFADGDDMIEIEIDQSVPAPIFVLLLEFWYTGIATLNTNKVCVLSLSLSCCFT